jgi:hypothetical protein
MFNLSKLDHTSNKNADILSIPNYLLRYISGRGRRDRIVVGFITTVPDLDKKRPYANPRTRCIIFLTLLLDFHIDAVITYSLNNPSVIVLPQLHSIENIADILNTPHHICLY